MIIDDASENEKYMFYDRANKLKLFSSILKLVKIKLNLVKFSLKLFY